MSRNIPIINPCGASSLKSATSTQRKENNMARKRKRRRATRRKAVKRRRRNAPYYRGKKHRPVVYATGRGRKRRLRRSPWLRLKPRRINRRRRNPKFALKRYFGGARMTNALMLLVGIGGAGILKGFVVNMLPEGEMKNWSQKLYGLASIIVGATVNTQGRRKATKSIGTGMVVFGLYDLLVSNIPQLATYLPTIGAPTAFDGYGRDVYGMGASISDGDIEVVGANISQQMTPEIIGEEMDLSDALEMSV